MPASPVDSLTPLDVTGGGGGRAGPDTTGSSQGSFSPRAALNHSRPSSSTGHGDMGSMTAAGGSGGGAGASGTAPQAKTSTRIAAVIFFKGLFGAGLLAIPGAFTSTGLPLGLLVFAAVSAICLGTMLMLLDCKRLVREERGVSVENYEELAGEVFGFRAFRAIQIVMALLTLIYCSGFVIVIASSLAAVTGLSRVVICAGIYPILVALSYFPYMKDLWHVSILGLATYLIGVVGVTFYYSSTHWDPPADVMDWRWRGLAHFYGVAVYSLEGINLTLPISASMKSIRKPPLVMTVGVVGFATITAAYAGYAYAAGLGEGCDIIVECLGDGAVVSVVRVALALSLIATHPVYLIVASEILERALILGDEGDADAVAVRTRIERLGGAEAFRAYHAPLPPPAAAPAGGQVDGNDSDLEQHQRQQQDGEMTGGGGQACGWLAGGTLSDAAKARVIRAAEVALTCVVGGAVRSLGAFTSIVGATFVTFVGFLMPTCMWVELQRHSHASHAARIRTYATAAAIILAGLIAMVVGTIEGVKSLARGGSSSG